MIRDSKTDAEVNIVTVTVRCPDGNTQTIRAYREEAHTLREFLNPYIDLM